MTFAAILNPMLRSPVYAQRMYDLLDYLRWHTSVPTKLNEMAILIVGRQWRFARAPMLAARKATADRFAAEVMPVIAEARAAGATTLQAIAAALNARGVATPQGKRWAPQSVKNVIGRASGEPPPYEPPYDPDELQEDRP